MAQYSNLKAYIEEKIYENGTQAITGDILQDVLKEMTDDLGEFYQMGGVASPSTDPGTPDAKVIYIATVAGEYTNFGGITLEAGEVALLVFDTSWTKVELNVLSAANGGVKNANLADGAVTTSKIAAGAVETAKIADNAVSSGKVADGAIGTAKIADAGVTADKIATNAVETAKIKNGAVTESKINDGAVTAGKVAANAVTTAKIADDAVTTAKLNDGAVTEDKIATDAVTSGKVKDGAISTAKIAAGAVTHAKIGAGAVEESNIKDGAVTSDKIANGAVGSDQLAQGAFSAGNLADGSVTTDKLADAAVTAEKIADGAVTAGKFANGSVTTIKLGSGAVITEKIGDGMVTRQKLADSSVSTAKIIDGAVTTAKVADSNITTAKIADANVTTAKIADANVTTGKIADGNVTGAKLQEGVRPVINVNALNEQTSAYGSAALARAAVPSALRILGLHIIYLLAGGWFEDEYIGSNVSGWGTASNWRAVGPVSVSQNTDTTSSEQGAEVLMIGDTATPIRVWNKYLTDAKGAENNIIEIYLTGLDLTKQYYASQFRQFIYEGQTYNRLDISEVGGSQRVAYLQTTNLTKGITPIVEDNNSGISGYAIINLESTDSVDKQCVFNTQMVATLDESPSIKTFLHVQVNNETLSIGGEEKGELAGVLVNSPEFIHVEVDSDNNIILGIRKDGSLYLPTLFAEKIKTHWYNKKWYAYGTSETNTDREGKYATFVAGLSGLQLINKGISGGAISGVPNANIKNAIFDDTDGKTEADLITLECLANDIVSGNVFGDVDDTDNSSFMGNLAQCITHLQEVTTATIVVIISTPPIYQVRTPSVRYLPTTKFYNHTLTWAEMADKMREMCEMYGVYFINPNWALGYHRMTEKYIKDNIHHTELGGLVYARYIWSQLKNIPQFDTQI